MLITIPFLEPGGPHAGCSGPIYLRTRFPRTVGHASRHAPLTMEWLALLGFALAAYAVIGNDVIQTLGTFIQSNDREPWWKLFLYIGGILAAVLAIGWWVNGGDVTYGRLDHITRPPAYTFWHVVPPVVLLLITRYGVPVSTTFMVLSIFSSQVLLTGMFIKSFVGYVLAFGSAFVLYQFALFRWEGVARITGRRNRRFWTVFQWCSTAFLWSQWLVQDFANIYVYLPATIDAPTLLLSLAGMLGILAFILIGRGGAIQRVVSNKHNAGNIRSATLIDLIYGGVLFLFTVVNNVPMSTTWAFVGVLGGREIALRSTVRAGTLREGWQLVGADFLKVSLGIGISVVITLFVKASS